jgi:xylose isomerase
MKTELKLASNLCPFSTLRDRFVSSGYTKGYAFNKQLELMSKVKGIDGVALGYPGHFQKGINVRKTLANHGLKLATLDTDIYTEARFKNGSLTNRDPAIRRAAIERAKQTMDAAAEVGAPDINLWPGHDGFEYFFQGHYADAWKWMMEGLEEIADHNPSMPIGIEYKCKEPRANIYLANMGKALMVVNKINRPNLGITLDVGHSLGALENPAECATLAFMEGRLQQIHLNDNYRDWDHDLIPGAVNVWDLIEFFFWVRKLGYAGWMCADIYPYREDDGSEVVKRTVQACQKSWRVAGRLLELKVETLLQQGRHLEIMRHLWDEVG